MTWVSWATIAVCVISAVVCLVEAARGKVPDDPSMLAILVALLALVVLTVVAIWLAVTGHGSVGDGLEWGGYMFFAFFVLIGTSIWGLIERTRVSTLILGLGALTVAVMVIRMHQIWFDPTWLPGQ